jgi:anaerobic magnesium-protoporphyrin IX monomethyl ester cyclase
MRVAFVYPPGQEVNARYYVPKLTKTMSKQGVVLPPLSLAYLAATLRGHGHEVTVLDANVLDLTEDQIARELKSFAPQALCFNLLTVTLHNNLFWIEKLKQHFDVPVIVGGPHLDLYYEETLTFPFIDYVVRGEGWVTLPELIGALETGKDPGDVPGMQIRKNGGTIFTGIRDGFTNLDSLPMPAREFLPVAKYRTVISSRRPVTSMLSSLGCPFRCRYCTVDKNLKFWSAKRITDEMQECQERHGIQEVLFYDATFTLHRKRVWDLCEEIINRKMDISWTIRTRADCIDERTIHRLAEAGCTRINYGIESGDTRIMKRIARDIPLAKTREVVIATKKAGIAPFGFFIIGCPGETRESIQNTIDFACSIPLDYVQINKMVPQPDTALYEEMVSKTGYDFWRQFALGKEDLKNIGPFDSEVNGEELDTFLKKAYRRFYFRPTHVINMAKRVRSLAQFREMALSAIAVS